MRSTRNPLLAVLVVSLVLFQLLQPLVAREWTDSTGTFRVIAELVAVRGDKVVLEKANGEIITIPINRLSAADQAFLRQQTADPATKTAMVPKEKSESPTLLKPSEVKPAGDALALAEQAEKILRTACHRCHGEDGTSEGGFNFVTNLEKLATTFAKPGGRSLLMERITAQEDSVMPPAGEEPRLSSAEIGVLQSWIAAGSPVRPSAETRTFITNDEIIKSIFAHINKVGERDRRFMRYFTLTHLYNAGVSEDELQTYRNAFSKLINSLSWNTELILPEVIDSAKTVFAIDMRRVHWNRDIWQAIEKANPYFLRLSTREAITCCELSETEMPFVRVDWFVFAASKPPLYHTVLGLPDSDRGLEELLRVNVQANIDQEQAIRAGFNRSGISQNNRLIEWHKSPYGSYWKSYDFGGNIGRQNLFEYPLGPASESGYFQHDGGEIIFSLPNGLQGYLLVDDSGKRIDQGPTNIVSDPKQPDRTVTNGVSCISCHFAGVIPKRDEVGVAVARNRAAFREADDILALYRPSKELDQLMARDSDKFAKVLQQLGINNISRSGESISAIAARFQNDIDLRCASAEFGLQPDDFLKRLEQSSQISRMFSSLTIEGGTLKRDVFKDAFQNACVDLNLTKEVNRLRTPSPSVEPPMTPKSNRSPTRRSTGAQITEVAKFEDLRWGVSALAFGQRGKLLVGGRPDNALTVFDVEGKSIAGEREKLEGLQSVGQCIFTPDGSRLIAGGRTGQITVFDVSREGLLKESGQFAGHSSEITSIAVSGDGKFVLSGEQAKKARYWELASGQELTLLDGFKGAVKAVHLSRNGRVAQATDGERLVEYDLQRKSLTRERPLTRSWSSGQAAAFAPDGETIAVGDTYNIRLWNLKTGRELKTLEGNEIQWSMVFSPDGATLLAGGNAKVSVWNVAKTQRIYVQNTSGTGYVQSLAISDDGQLFAAPGSSNRELHIYQLP